MALLCPIFNGVPVIDANGDPVVGGTLRTYLSGTSTPAATFADYDETANNPVEIPLNSRGYAEDQIWLAHDVEYRLWPHDAGGVPVGTAYDHVVGVLPYVPPADPVLPPVPPPSTAWDGSLWVQSALTPVFVSATEFSVSGDESVLFAALKAALRPLKISIVGGYRYGTIGTITYGGGVTTVSVTLDSGVLTSPVGVLWYGGDQTGKPLDANMLRNAWPPSANLPLGSKKFTGAAAPVNNDEFVTLGYANSTYQALVSSSTYLKKDGTVVPTANLPMGNYRLTGLGNATTGTDALNRNTADSRYSTSSDISSYVSSYAPSLTNYSINGSGYAQLRPTTGGAVVYNATSGSSYGWVQCSQISVDDDYTTPLTSGGTGVYFRGTYPGGIVCSAGNGAIVLACGDAVGTGVVCVTNAAAPAYVPIYASAFTVSSIEDVKDDIKPLKGNVVADLAKLRTITHKYKDDSAQKQHLGLLVEDIEPMFPEAVYRSPKDGAKGLDYGRLSVLAIAAIKELSERLETLEKKLA